MPRAIIMVTLLAALVAVMRRAVRHVVVEGPSMLPALAPGDRVVLLLIPGRPRVGDLVATTDPRAPQRVLLKRVHAIDGHLIDVRGDNPAASTDSRTFGPVPATTVRRCVGWRYQPARRAPAVGRYAPHAPRPRRP